ncbi:MAG: thioredoxin domain-containing protein [Tepidisphaeraceae bacterium]
MKLEQHAPRLAIPVTERDHAQGPADAPVTLVEYGDYECPYCGKVYPIVKEIQKRMAGQGGRLRFVFRNFPLNTIHEHAGVAAQAAEIAGGQGGPDKFWAMHDLLYEHQDELAEADVTQYALKIGLEIYKFEANLASGKYAARVREDFRGGVRSGVNGTPTFFINDLRYNGPHALEPMLEALEKAAAGT